MQVTLTANRPLGTLTTRASNQDKEPLAPDDLFKPSRPEEPEKPRDPGEMGWGHTAAFTLAGAAAGAVSGFTVGAHMGGFWGGAVGAVLNLIPSAALGLVSGIAMSETDLPTPLLVGVPLAVGLGGIGTGIYWGATGNLGGPIGLAITGGLTGALLIGIWGYTRSDEGFQKKQTRYSEQMSQYDNDMRRHKEDLKAYDREIQAWESRHEGKTSTRIVEGTKRLLLNGIALKKREAPKEAQGGEDSNHLGC